MDLDARERPAGLLVTTGGYAETARGLATGKSTLLDASDLIAIEKGARRL